MPVATPTISEPTLTSTAAPVSTSSSTSITFPKIDRRPPPSSWNRKTITSIPKYDPNIDASFQVDLLSYDLSALDLRGSLDNLLYADFDNRTKWPSSDKLPQGFDWKRIMEWGKNSGLGILQLRAQGVTGQGVNAAVIDGPLLTEHQEYADRLQLYEEINILDPKWEAAPHGSAVASLALGKTVGVAPEANLYYVAMWPSDKSRSEDFITTFTT